MAEMIIFQKLLGILAHAKWRTETAVMLAAARFLVKFIPFRYWRNSLGAIDSASLETNQIPITEASDKKAVRVARWVRDTAEKVPFEAVCLPQAMAGRWMLLRRGVPTQLFIGTKRDKETNAAHFHAWLMHGDNCLTGNHEREEFQAFSKSTHPKEAL